MCVVLLIGMLVLLLLIGLVLKGELMLGEMLLSKLQLREAILGDLMLIGMGWSVVGLCGRLCKLLCDTLHLAHLLLIIINDHLVITFFTRNLLCELLSFALLH